MQRISLNDLEWKLGEAGTRPLLPASVPGCVHADLLRNGKIEDPFYGTNELDLQWVGQREWVYVAYFEAGTELLDAENIELVADGLDTLATVFLNGKQVAQTDNMFIGHRWGVRSLLKKGRNEIRIVFADAEAYIRTTYPEYKPVEFNDPVGRSSLLRKEQCQFGWDWGPRFVTAGIWRDIRLEAWSGNRIEHLKIVQEHIAAKGASGKKGAAKAGAPAAQVERVCLRVGAELARPAQPAILRARLTLDKVLVASTELVVGGKRTTRAKAASAQSRKAATKKIAAGGRGKTSAAKAASAKNKSVHLRSGEYSAGVPGVTTTGGEGAQRAVVQSELSADPLANLPELVLEILQPQLWWPVGHGEQPLYELEVELVDEGSDTVLDRAQRRIGLRTIVLDRSKDEWGETFRFVINGRPVFAKGANWIPAHSFVAQLTRADYERDISAAAEANMNILRVWGGGIYESEAFYDLCEEYGLLVWQDFMFACTLPPDRQAFRDSVRLEARYQIRRLHYRTALALWCGNNELTQLNKPQLLQAAERKSYEKIFHQILPQELAAQDGTTCYWPTSEWRGRFDTTHADGEICGDTHFWDVWHARHPVKDYEKWHFRFCSEFGMQSYSSPATQATFCPPDQANIFGAVMENHQKNRGGNQVILDYVSRRYRFPKDQAALIYLSQINQAYCMSVGIEHFRRISPRCMGAIYWQLNDCWPVASWSSIEFTGNWKALHYNARRFFAPALVSAHVLEEEGVTIGNYRKPGSGRVDLYTVYDAPERISATLCWELRALGSAAIITSGKKQVRLSYGQSVRQRALDFSRELEAHGRDNVYLRIALQVQDKADVAAGKSAAASRGASGKAEPTVTEVLSEDTVFFAPPRFLQLPTAKTKTNVRRLKAGLFEVRFTSNAFQHRFMFELEGSVVRGSDNFFDLYPGQTKTVTVKAPATLTKAEFVAALRYRSLVDASA